jgi:predicted transcriptional regulator
MARRTLPDLSRFELQCLRRLWARGEASVREIHQDLPQPPSYSTVRKIIERLEEKGAVERVRRDGKNWIYRSTVSAPAMIRKEIRRFLDGLFDGSAAPLVAHLAEMEAVTLEDLREVEKHLSGASRLQRGSDRDAEPGR